MPSKYSKKKPEKKEDPQAFFKKPEVKPVCTNCGRVSTLSNPQFSKCYCGGTLQTFGQKANRA